MDNRARRGARRELRENRALGGAPEIRALRHEAVQLLAEADCEGHLLGPRHFRLALGGGRRIRRLLCMRRLRRLPRQVVLDVLPGPENAGKGR
jgi:hypothetical protein